MTPGTRPTRTAFSLIEILVSLGLLVFLLTLGTQAFVQVRTFTQRLQARQVMHASARVIVERLRSGVASLEQVGALWLRSDDGSGTRPRGVELVFLRGKLDHHDFDRRDNYGHYRVDVTDLVWERWRWDADTRNLTCASSSPSRIFQVQQSWTQGGIDYRNQWFANLPTPRRQASGGPESIDVNAYGSGEPKDIGDYQDLLRNSVPIAMTCSALRFELVLMDGTVIAADGATTAEHGLDGVLVDGTDAAAIARRPRLLRIGFDLTDDRIHFTESFSFTVQAPGLLPP